MGRFDFARIKRCGEFAAHMGGGEVLGEQTHFDAGMLGEPVQRGDGAALKVPRHQQMAHDDTLPRIPDALNCAGDDIPIVWHAADAFATACRAAGGAEFEIGEIDVNRAIQQFEGFVCEIEVAVKDGGDGAPPRRA